MHWHLTANCPKNGVFINLTICVSPPSRVFLLLLLLSSSSSSCSLDLSHTTTTYLVLNYIVTCGPFLGNELANTLPRRDRFLETNWLRNTVSMNTKTESCKHLETRQLLGNLNMISETTHS
jgi:hypothetical protein